MLEHELKEVWKNTSQTENISFNSSQLMNDLNNKMSRLEKIIRIRDLREISASVFGILLFGYFTYEIPFLLTKIASVLGMIWFAYVIYRLKNIKKNKQPTDLTLSLRDQLENQKFYMLQHARLLDTVLYWYVLPPFLMNILFVAGLGDPVEYGWSHIFAKVLPLSINMKIITLVGIASFNLFTIWINKRAVKKDIKPVIKEIERVINEFESEN